MINIKCKIKTSRKKQQQQKEILHSRMQLANRLSIVIRSRTDQPSKWSECICAHQNDLNRCICSHCMPLPNILSSHYYYNKCFRVVVLLVGRFFFLRYVIFSAHLRLLHINLTTFAFICSILGLPSLLLPKHAFYVWQFWVRFIWLLLLTLLTISLTHVIFLIFSFTRPEFSVEIYLWHKLFGCQSNVKQLPRTGKMTLYSLFQVKQEWFKKQYGLGKIKRNCIRSVHLIKRSMCINVRLYFSWTKKVHEQ